MDSESDKERLRRAVYDICMDGGMSMFVIKSMLGVMFDSPNPSVLGRILFGLSLLKDMDKLSFGAIFTGETCLIRNGLESVVDASAYFFCVAPDVSSTLDDCNLLS